MKTSEGINFWAFVENPTELKDNVSLCNGKTVKEWLTMKFSSRVNFGVDDLTHGFYKIGGWAFDLRPFMKKYIYTSYGSVFTGYAPNVKSLRKVNYLNRQERVALAPKVF